MTHSFLFKVLLNTNSPSCFEFESDEKFPSPKTRHVCAVQQLLSAGPPVWMRNEGSELFRSQQDIVMFVESLLKSAAVKERQRNSRWQKIYTHWLLLNNLCGHPMLDCWVYGMRLNAPCSSCLGQALPWAKPCDNNLPMDICPKRLLPIGLYC